MTLHLDNSTDDTTSIYLDQIGISHLIGVSIIDSPKPSWKSVENGGMVALITTPIQVLPYLLHDILLDMAMIHSKSQQWSGIKEQFSSQIIAALKARFIGENKQKSCYDDIDLKQYKKKKAKIKYMVYNELSTTHVHREGDLDFRHSVYHRNS